MGKLELPLQTGQMVRLAVVLAEDLQCDRAVRARGVVRPVHRRISAVAQGCVDDVSLEPLARRKHLVSLGL